LVAPNVVEMASSQISSEGQMTLPEEICDRRSFIAATASTFRSKAGTWCWRRERVDLKTSAPCFLTRDDPRQAASARRFLDANVSADEPAFVNRIVLIEIAWVLESAYDEYGRGEITAVIEGIFETTEFLVEDAVRMLGGIARYRADATLAATNSSISDASRTFGRSTRSQGTIECAEKGHVTVRSPCVGSPTLLASSVAREAKTA